MSECGVTGLTDTELLDRLTCLQGRSVGLLAELLVHLGEVDARRLYAPRACSSMHRYCVERLGMSGGAAYKRIAVARAGREFPFLLEVIGAGRLHLSGAVLLVPHLEGAGHRGLIEAACGLGKRDIERMLAARAPKPPVPTRIRRLPRAAAAVQSGAGGSGGGSSPTILEVGSESAAASVSGPSTGPEGAGAPPALRLTPPPRTRIEPLSADTYRVTFTASQGVVEALEAVTALLSHAIPSGNINEVLESVLTDAQERLIKRRFGARGKRTRRGAKRPHQLSPGTVPEGGRELSPGRVPESGVELSPGTVLEDGRELPPGIVAVNRTRYINADVRGAVYVRDEGRCTFVDPVTGNGCGERRFIELHHTEPYALGGGHTVEGITLRCRAHNLLDARLVFGDAAIDRHLPLKRPAEPVQSAPTLIPMASIPVSLGPARAP